MRAGSTAATQRQKVTAERFGILTRSPIASSRTTPSPAALSAFRAANSRAAADDHTERVEGGEEALHHVFLELSLGVSERARPHTHSHREKA